MMRRLDAFESALALSDSVAPLNVVAVLRLAKGPPPDVLEQALNRLQHRHPLLRARITQGVDGHVFEPSDPLGIAVRRASRDRSDQWVDEAEAELNQRFDAAAGPLMRGVYVGSGDGPCEVLLTFHHGIMDAASAMHLCRELLVASEEGGAAQVLELLPEQPAAETFFPASYQGWRRGARLAVFALRQVRGEIRDRWRVRGRWHPPPPEPCRGRILSFQLSEAETSGLTRCARRHRVTLHSVFDAAMLLTVARHRYGGQSLPLRHLVFANLRPYLDPPVSDENLGAYFAMLRFSTAVHPQRELWELAAEINREVYTASKRGEKFAFSLTSAMMMRNILRLGSQRMAATALSYTGVAKLDRDSPFPVVGLHAFVSSFRLGPEYTAQVRLFAGRLWWDILYLDSEMEPAEAEQLADEIRKLLSVEAAVS